MKKVKMATSDSYQNYLVKSLKDEEEAAAYIEAILEVRFFIGSKSSRRKERLMGIGHGALIIDN